MNPFWEDRPDEIPQQEMGEIKARIVEIVNIALGLSENLEFFPTEEKPANVRDRVYRLVKDAEITCGRPFADKLAILARYTLVTKYDVRQPEVASAMEVLTNYYRSIG